MSPPNLDSLDAGRGSDPNKPCRVCTDFKTWAKMQAQTFQNTSLTKSESSRQISTFVSSSDKNPPKECPLDKDELGAATWSFLHTMAAYYPDKPTIEQQTYMKQFISSFSQFYPCDHCAEDFRKQIAETPPVVKSQESLSRWFCDIHNVVNKKVRKPIFDCSKVNERWRDGWLDGSCD